MNSTAEHLQKTYNLFMGSDQKLIYLLPDTNLFIQCRALAMLDWTIWQDFDEVHLVVTRPVQREIDSQKSTGKGRVNKRARKTSTLFRKAILSDEQYVLLRKENPRVILYLRNDLLPDNSLIEKLNYAERDDQLVGTLSTFVNEHQSGNVFLLTHDTGPMATARMLDLPFYPVPDDWLGDPEGTQLEKTIQNLEGELKRYKNAEPRFEIIAEDANGINVDKLSIEICRYDPLAEAEIETLMAQLQESYPLATDFGSRESRERKSPLDSLGIGGYGETYSPANDGDITEYRETLYPNWLKKCEDKLRKLHNILQSQAAAPSFCFVAKNIGVRPAHSTLVEIEAFGSLEIAAPAKVNSENEDAIVSLPNPPIAPKGQWKTKFHSSLGATSRLIRDMQRHWPPNDAFLRSPINLPDITPQSKDANEFYYKPGRPIFPTKTFQLECKQWRHGVDSVDFLGEIHILGNEENVSGAIECRIHAENLSETASLRVPVRISCKCRSVFEDARILVETLSDSSAY